MINKERIVPITKIDLLTLIGTIFGINGTSYSVVDGGIEGDFTVTGSGAAGNVLANEPMKSLNFASGVTSATVYFVAAYDFPGNGAFKINGAAATMGDGSVTVNPDCATLYKAVLGSNNVTVSAVSPVVA